MSDTAIPTISFVNDLPIDMVVYDSYVPKDETADEDNYYGRLTSLGTAKAKTTTVVQPIHTSTTFILQNATDTKPVYRCVKKSYNEDLLSFNVEQANLDAMTTTFKFIDFITKNPSDAMSTAFAAILKDTDDPLEPAVTKFFTQYPDYATCTFVDYMMGMVYNAKNPPPPDTPPAQVPPDQVTYSLSKLVTGMGGKWPDGMPDLSVSNFTCTNKNSVFEAGLDIDISVLPFETPEIAANIKTLFPDSKITCKIQFNYALSLSIFATRLSLDFDNFKIPVGGSDNINVTKPTITLDINPLFKFVVLTIKGTIPFNMLNTAFDANVSITIDNVEANVGVVIAGDNASFPAPPVMKGLHVDEVGVGMGIWFEPPGFVLGVEGKFHIGATPADNSIALNDDTIVMVCKIESEVPEPLYASFYVPKMDVNQVVSLFTNASPNINVPIEFSDMSFRWAENPMEPIVLPDGSLSEMAYGFSAAINIFTFGFYGDVAIDMTNGLTANVQASPLSWGTIFKMSGDGPGVKIKVDKDGNPIRNNEIRDKKVLNDALATATDKQIVTPGGPVLIINTFTMPILHMNAKVSLFDLADFAIEADINKDGINFMLDYGIVLKEKMNVTLSDFHNLAASFTYYIDRTINVPIIAGVKLGSFHLTADVETHFGIKTSLTDIILSIGGNFNFEGLGRSFGDFTGDIHINKITDFLETIGKYIEQNAKDIFSDFLNDAQAWANKVKAGFLTGCDAVGLVLKNVWNEDGVGITSIMKNAGYAAGEIASNIENAWNCGIKDVCWAMNQFGYSAADIASSVKSAFNASAQDVVNSLKWLGSTANDVGNVIKNVFGGDSVAVASIMKAAGYSADQVGGAIKNAWNCSETDVAYAMRQVGYTANEVGNTLKDTFNGGINDVAGALKNVGYAATDVASTLKNTFNTSADAVGDAMKSVGYAANDVKNAFQSLGGDFASAASTVEHTVSGWFS